MILSNKRRILTSPELAFHGLELSGEQHTQHICKLRRKSRTTFLSRVELWLLLELLKAFYLGSFRCMTDSIIMAYIYQDTTQRLKILFLWKLYVKYRDRALCVCLLLHVLGYWCPKSSGCWLPYWSYLSMFIFKLPSHVKPQPAIPSHAPWRTSNMKWKGTKSGHH